MDLTVDKEASQPLHDKPQYDLKNVIFQRDNLQDRLNWAHEEMQKLQDKLDHYKDVQIELETFEDETLEEMERQIKQADPPKDLPSMKEAPSTSDTIAEIKGLSKLPSIKI